MKAICLDRQSCGNLAPVMFFWEIPIPLTIESLEFEALQLNAADRARLIERLIASLDTDPEIEDAWATEVERRHAEIENSGVTPLSGVETLARLRAEFK